MCTQTQVLQLPLAKRASENVKRRRSNSEFPPSKYEAEFQPQIRIHSYSPTRSGTPPPISFSTETLLPGQMARPCE